jgi:hypothetical protein
VPLIRSSPITPPSPQSGTETIERDLEHGTSDQRWDAARAAAHLPDGLRLLRRAMSIERDPRIREAILTSLARIGTPECAEAVLPDLRSDDSRLRAAALDALRAMPAAAAVHLPRLLHEASCSATCSPKTARPTYAPRLSKRWLKPAVLTCCHYWNSAPRVFPVIRSLLSQSASRANASARSVEP